MDPELNQEVNQHTDADIAIRISGRDVVEKVNQGAACAIRLVGTCTSIQSDHFIVKTSDGTDIRVECESDIALLEVGQIYEFLSVIESGKVIESTRVVLGTNFNLEVYGKFLDFSKEPSTNNFFVPAQ